MIAVVVVNALCYKLEGRGFENRLSEFFFNIPNPSGRTRPWGSLSEPLTEMSTRSRKIMFLGSRARPVRRADSLIAICEPIV
jgi:hypothetical protein